MPISPSDLEWWGWLLVAAVAALLSAIIGFISNKDDGAGGCLAAIIAWLFGLTALVTFIIAVIRFVKWVWTG